MHQPDHADAVKTARLCRAVEETLALALAALGRVQGLPRSEVARAIRRKRAPELLFRLA